MRNETIPPSGRFVVATVVLPHRGRLDGCSGAQSQTPGADPWPGTRTRTRACPVTIPFASLQSCAEARARACSGSDANPQARAHPGTGYGPRACQTRAESFASGAASSEDRRKTPRTRHCGARASEEKNHRRSHQEL